MKVLIINGSPRVGGNTSIALDEMVKVFETEGVDTEVVQIGIRMYVDASPAGPVSRKGNVYLMM